MVLLAGWGLASLSVYVVRTAGGVQVITKNKLSLVDTYVDVRTWNSADEEKHQAFYDRVKQLEQTKLLEVSAVPDEREAESETKSPPVNSPSIRSAWARVNAGRGR